jgi:TetR/AcrR family transcriptional regulator, tetracycline repressor protein
MFVRRIVGTMFDVTDLPPAPWAKKAKPAKAEAKPALTRQAIVDAALRIVDTEGLDAVSMRRIAQDLGTGAASLYAHVTDKEELIDLVVDQIMGEMTQLYPLASGAQTVGGGGGAGTGTAAGTGTGGENGGENGGAAATDGAPAVPVDPAEWQEQLKMMARTCLKVLIAHGDVARAFVGRIPFGPNGLVAIESQLELLRSAGMPDHMAAFAGDLLGQFVTGFAADEVGWRGRFPNNTDEEKIEHLTRLREYLGALPAERFPNVIAMAGTLLSGENEGLSRFELGLEVLIRGLGSFVRQPQSPAQPRSPGQP